MTITLYSMPSSGNSYKARLLLAFLGAPYVHKPMEYETEALADAHASGELPLGKVPVLVTDSGDVIPESNAILYYLAQGTDWWPSDSIDQTNVLGWMFFEQNRHETVIAVRAALRKYASRAHLATPERMAELLEAGHGVLQIMEDHLRTRNWLVGSSPTIADVSLYAYTHSAGEFGGFEMSRFPGVSAWLDRLAALPGYVGLDDWTE